MAASQQHMSSDTPMGANLTSGGATFRVWAPTADAVYVVLRNFDQSLPGHWSPNDADKLQRRNAYGRWTGFFPGVTDGSPIASGPSGPAGRVQARPLRARARLYGGYPDCNCIVRSTTPTRWHDTGFRPPASTI